MMQKRLVALLLQRRIVQQDDVIESASVKPQFNQNDVKTNMVKQHLCWFHVFICSTLSHSLRNRHHFIARVCVHGHSARLSVVPAGCYSLFESMKHYIYKLCWLQRGGLGG